MQTIYNFFREYRKIIIWAVFIMLVTGAIEYLTGRSLLGPDGAFGWWEGSIWSSENSQRVADAYSFSHIIHGMVFYGFLWLTARKVPIRYRFIIALLMEAVWELFENSPIIIDRYRSVTIALGYVGDSVLNSVSDIVMAGIGFVIAKYSKVWITIILIIIMELGCLFWIRDNLTLNVVMLVYPIKSIQTWQSAKAEEEMCFTRNTEDGGSENIIMKIQGKNISGVFDYSPFEKDRKTGSFTGTKENNEITAQWKASAEGVTQTEELRILLGDGIASPGFGEMKTIENGTSVYANPEQVDYSMNLSLIDCAESPLK